MRSVGCTSSRYRYESRENDFDDENEYSIENNEGYYYNDIT